MHFKFCTPVLEWFKPIEVTRGEHRSHNFAAPLVIIMILHTRRVLCASSCTQEEIRLSELRALRLDRPALLAVGETGILLHPLSSLY